MVDFEAQDDGYLAKILIDSGSNEIALGSVIAIVVEEESDVPAFANYKVEDAGSSSVPADAGKTPPSKEQTPAPVQSTPAASPTTPLTSTPRFEPVAAAPVRVPEPTPVTVESGNDDSYIAFPNWGTSLHRSPLGPTFLKKQKEYVEKYGFAGQDLE